MRPVGESSWVCVTGVYGTAYRKKKASFWDWMSNNFRPSYVPWHCGGEFMGFFRILRNLEVHRFCIIGLIIWRLL